MEASPQLGALPGSGPIGSGSGLSSPASLQPGSLKRNRSLSASQGSADEGDPNLSQADRRRLPGVKRACNECRQQKLRCDVVQDPFAACSRCRRLNLECKIQSNFKRIGKRSKNAEMEREIIELKRQLAVQGQSPSMATPPLNIALGGAAASPGVYQIPPRDEQYMGSHEAVASLLDLRQGLDGSGSYISTSDAQAGVKRLETVALTPERVADLFSHYFTFYHPFLPVLDPQKPPDHYFEVCPLLFWVVIATASRRYTLDGNLLDTISGPVSRLMWSTLASVPQNYHIVKALCLLCMWPSPMSSTSLDPTFMLCGTMMQIALQIGLHRPSHAQDFTKFRVEVRDEELKDRVKTWAACNIVAQSVATGYGQPPATLYDWTLAPAASDSSYKLPDELDHRLQIERFCDKVTKALYNNPRDPVGLSADDERSVLTTLLSKDFLELEERVGETGSPITQLHLRAAGLHLRLAAFFDASTNKDYLQDLVRLYFATTSFLDSAFSFEVSGSNALPFSSNYIMQMMVAAGFTLLKLLNSFFARSIDLDAGKTYFNRTIWSIRAISVNPNDLPSRLAEVLAQLWRAGEAVAASRPTQAAVAPDSSLQLKVRCRMSMSLVFDSVWRWREEFQAKGRGNLDSAVSNPTNPDASADGSSNSAALDSMGPNAGAGLAGAGPLLGANSVNPVTGSFSEPNYEVFDPLNWMLDGLVDFPYSLTNVGGLEPPGGMP
ncbi:hypothetical protein L228DRAFT_252699 [Xylona heveae TC161]|uniref:Zn(2)-C6 fungal-type domain-containing protein n=1 Tax=Xylona heveae (strain CBS 132557 / TC161) TaxID=1328760 RepID=A0A165I6X1_XYLHT|nr:hypothetical protein L228DRAFT_252699 [Xylona heveae TC161]KZF24478.1 hypothetical protein L228DRAFT_252699 [Xylona heveae TC161]